MKRDHEFEGDWEGLGEALEGRKIRENCFNYVVSQFFLKKLASNKEKKAKQRKKERKDRMKEREKEI